MGIKEYLLDIIKKQDGISHNDIIAILKENPYNIILEHKNMGYSYLSRLKEKGLIESINGYVNGKKHYTYKATSKAFLTKEQIKDNEAKLTSILKRLILKESISDEETEWMVGKCQL